uniref:Female-specific orf protein n=1 Tax=Toxolasma glans TaxID=422002 RepID=F4ZFM7_9BIVA|nr:female-specific orf protein [Toxolasma glans]AEC14111.1 female-specific orf protein [Toxolasma glans]AEC14112.1 female-specific orf protein [Toxolasma glans]AEC14113.1 female-specific orf protein [Toxolasma glans]AEC14114.1 female-specific orf protein [Toxolasma glans]
MLNALGYQQLTLVIKMKHSITSMLQNKKTQKLAIISVISFLMFLPLNMFYSIPESMFPKPFLTDNTLEQNQPISTPPSTSTGSHPLKNSPASTDISNKT